MSRRGARAAEERILRRPRGAGTGLVVASAVLVLLAGCERESRTTLTGHPVRERDIARLTIGRSTAGDVERVLGPPDERAADGSLVYRAAAVRSEARRVAGFTWAAREEVRSHRVARFRFADGVLTQVCRERS